MAVSVAVAVVKGTYWRDKRNRCLSEGDGVAGGSGALAVL